MRQSVTDQRSETAGLCRIVIVFALAICYSRAMGHKIDLDSSTRLRGGYRRGLLMVLAFVYLFVGVAHNMSCFDQAVASSFAIETVADASQDGGLKSGLALCDHCPTCVSAVMPAPVAAAAPCGLPASSNTSVSSLLEADHAWLDTPPPKALT